MKRLLVKTALFFIVLLLANWTEAQFYDSTLSKYEEQFPKEKIHIHFDKSIYNQNETIFYKLYILEGFELTSLSKHVYVVWYDANGNYLKQTVAPLDQSSAKGSFDVPSNYKGDFIHMKAFTRWMLNDDSVFLYEKNIPVYTGSASIDKSPTPKTSIEIFPESGVLVEGLNSKVAFKATNGFGVPVFIKGYLMNDKNVILDTLKVAHDGMGFFHLNPKLGAHYHLNWIDENSQEGTSPIIEAKKEGVTLAISMGYKKAYATVERTAHVPNNYKQLKLLVHQNQHLLYSVDFKSGEPLQQKIGLNIDTFPTGIVQFSLFTSDWLPLAERIVFVNNQMPEFNAKVSITTSDLNKRGKNTIEVQVADTIEANMSVSITDASIVIPEQQTIYSDFLLSNEIRGKIVNPAYYFSSDADSVADHLDLVMLTNGWRKFDWDKMRLGVLPVLKYPIENDYMKLAGNILLGSKTKLPKDLFINIAIEGKDSSMQMLFLPVNKDGSFEGKTSLIYDTSRISYSLNGLARFRNFGKINFENGLLKNNTKKISLVKNEYKESWNETIAKEKLNYYLIEQEKLRKQMESATLKEVVVHSFMKSNIQILDEEYTSGMFKGGDGFYFDLENDITARGAGDIASYLSGKLSQRVLNSNSIFFLDEQQVTNCYSTSGLPSIPLSNIAYIKVLRPPFVGVVGGGNAQYSSIPGGIIAIYTKHASTKIDGAKPSKELETSILGGYSVFKEFYSPNYEMPTGNFLADTRTTLYWNPFLKTDSKNQKIKIDFYNNDSSKKLQIVLEGVNANGKFTRVVKYLE